MAIAIFGSAFNPPTLGHKDAIKQCLESPDVTEVWLVPSFKHAFGKSMGSYSSRCSITEAFASDLMSEGMRVKLMAIEHDIEKEDGSSIYSYDLMSHIQATYKGDDFKLALGEDNVINLSNFYKGDELISKWDLISIKDLVPIRSTLVRNQLNNNEPINDLVTKSVLKEIRRTGQSFYWK